MDIIPVGRMQERARHAHLELDSSLESLVPTVIAGWRWSRSRATSGKRERRCYEESGLMASSRLLISNDVTHFLQRGIYCETPCISWTNYLSPLTAYIH